MAINMHMKDCIIFIVKILFVINRPLINLLLSIDMICNDHTTLMYIQGEYFLNVIGAYGQLTL